MKKTKDELQNELTDAQRRTTRSSTGCNGQRTERNILKPHPAGSGTTG